MFDPIFSLVAGLMLAFGLQVGLVSALTAFVKESVTIKGKPLDGRAVKIASFVIGGILGCVMLWVARDLVQETLPLSAWVLVGLLFIPGSGLVASGYYDYKK